MEMKTNTNKVLLEMTELKLVYDRGEIKAIAHIVNNQCFKPYPLNLSPDLEINSCEVTVKRDGWLWIVSYGRYKSRILVCDSCHKRMKKKDTHIFTIGKEAWTIKGSRPVSLVNMEEYETTPPITRRNVDTEMPLNLIVRPKDFWEK